MTERRLRIKHVPGPKRKSQHFPFDFVFHDEVEQVLMPSASIDLSLPEMLRMAGDPDRPEPRRPRGGRRGPPIYLLIVAYREASGVVDVFRRKSRASGFSTIVKNPLVV